MKSEDLEKAISERNLDAVHEYICGGGDVNVMLPCRKRPLVHALNSCRRNERGTIDEIILNLIDAGANVNARNKNSRRTATMLAISKHRYDEIILKLINAGTNCRLRAKRRITALNLALDCRYGKSVIRALIDNDSDVNYPPNSKLTPLFFAVRDYRIPEIIEMILDAGAEVPFAFAYDHMLTLCCLGRCKTDEICRFKRVTDIMVKKGVDICEKDCLGNTIIHLTTCNYVINLAQRHGVLIDAANNLQHTPLIQSLVYENEDKVNDLLLIGANPNWVDSQRNNALHILIDYKLDTFSNLLVYHGADIHAVNISGETPLTASLRVIERNFFGDEDETEEVSYQEGLYIMRIKSIVLNYLLYEDARRLFDMIAGPRIDSFENDELICYIDACLTELNVMSDTPLTADYSISQFCYLKRFYSSSFIPIGIDEYLIDHYTISINFPNYKDIILMRLIDNSRKHFKQLLLKALKSISVGVESPKHGDELETVLICMHQKPLQITAKYLNYRKLYALIRVSFNA